MNTGEEEAEEATRENSNDLMDRLESEVVLATILTEETDTAESGLAGGGSEGDVGWFDTGATSGSPLATSGGPASGGGLLGGSPLASSGSPLAAGGGLLGGGPLTAGGSLLGGGPLAAGSGPLAAGGGPLASSGTSGGGPSPDARGGHGSGGGHGDGSSSGSGEGFADGGGLRGRFGGAVGSGGTL